MGAFLAGYVVDLDLVRRAIGSRDAAVLAAVRVHLDHDNADAVLDGRYGIDRAGAARELVDGPLALGHRYHRDLYWDGVEGLCRRYGEWLPPRALAAFRLPFLDLVPEIKTIVYGRAPRPIVALIGEPYDRVVSWVPRDAIAETIAWFDAGGPSPPCGCPSADLLAMLRSLVESGQRPAATRLAAERLGLETAAAWKLVGASPWVAHARHEAERVPARTDPLGPELVESLAEFRSWLVRAHETQRDLVVFLSL